APSVVWRLVRGTRRLKLFGERVVTPMWSDLAPLVAPFLQDAWVGGAELGVGDRARAWLELSGLAAETGNHALIERFPIRELSLRYGWTPDPLRTDDAMGTLAAGVEVGAVGLHGHGLPRGGPAA